MLGRLVPALLIWLGKVVLHQKEKTGITLEATDTLADFIGSTRKAEKPRHPVMADYAEDNGERPPSPRLSLWRFCGLSSW